MQAAAAPRQSLKPRHVIYKSTALERTAPSLVAAASPDAVSAARSIQKAHDAAEAVRLSYKATKDVDVGTLVDGDDDASNAKKYERRLKMNRQSAAASRVRREAYTKALEAELVTMENQYKATILKLEAALERNRQLEKTDPPAMDHVHHPAPPDLKQEDEEEQLVVTDAADPVQVEHVEDVKPVVHLDDDDDNDNDDDAAFFHTLVSNPQFTLNPKEDDDFLSHPAFVDNMDVLQFPVPETLPDCFLHPPNDQHDLADNNIL